jgi:prevent-host-death family protein
LERAFDRTLTQLERLQRIREGQPLLPQLDVEQNVSRSADLLVLSPSILTETISCRLIRLAATSLDGGVKMVLVGAFEAKTHLAELLDRVSRGEKITITRHGIPAAMLVPIDETRTRMTHKDIVEGMRKLRKRIKPGKMSVRELVEEGRRF